MTPENQIKLMKVIEDFSKRLDDLVSIADKQTEIILRLDERVTALEELTSWREIKK